MCKIREGLRGAASRRFPPVLLRPRVHFLVSISTGDRAHQVESVESKVMSHNSFKAVLVFEVDAWLCIHVLSWQTEQNVIS